jgi:hypothetical protein
LILPILGCPGVYTPTPNDDEAIGAAVLRWNKIAVDASGLDHTAVAEGENRVFGHQLGPTHASRAMAITHIAIMDTVVAIRGGYESYTRLATAPANTSAKAAIAQAAHDTLVALYPSHAPQLGLILAEDLDSIAEGAAKDNGIALGREAAEAILAMREADGSELEQQYTFSDEVGAWRIDPMNPDQKPHGPEWHRVKPFALNGATQFRCPPPPAMDSAEFTDAYNEAKALGGDGIITPTIRTPEETQIGTFWAYDGTPSLCAPPRLYNQIATQLAVEQGFKGVELARLLTVLNVGLADAGIAAWDSKYYYNFCRPVTAIREADEGTGPTGLGDGNPDTIGDTEFVPLGAPASNLAGPNFTPPFPAYPSGHATFGGMLFETLREAFGTDDITFTFVSDELNGVTTDNEGNVRPLVPRTFTSLSQAEEENGQSRIYLGIHWSFDKTEGITMGRNVADHVMSTVYRPTN